MTDAEIMDAAASALDQAIDSTTICSKEYWASYARDLLRKQPYALATAQRKLDADRAAYLKSEQYQKDLLGLMPGDW